MTFVGLAVVGVVIAAASAFGLWRRKTDGAFKTAPTKVGSAPRLSSSQVGTDLGKKATLVQFSSAFCQPCRATSQILDRVAGDIAGVKYVEIDTEAHLDLAREFNILRTPTVFVLDSAGVITNRASGQPRYADVVAAVGRVDTDFEPDLLPHDRSGADSHTLDPKSDPSSKSI